MLCITRPFFELFKEVMRLEGGGNYLSNHFGNLNEAKLITNFFLKSSFKSITFMCHTKSWYENHKKNGYGELTTPIIALTWVAPTTTASTILLQLLNS